jgi:hypothetical protein
VATFIDGFDHALIGVADLEAARLDWQRLGFTTCPRGKHVGWGTANYCIMFATDYLELLGIVDASQFTNNLDTFLARHGEGLLGMAFASSDLEGLAEKLGGQPQDLKRLLELADGTVQPRFRLLHPPPGTLPGLSGFFCRHLTPELMRRPEWLIHANGARGIAWMTIAVAEVAAATVDYEQVLGQDFVSRKVKLVQAADEPGFCDLGIDVADLAACAAFFETAGISYIEDKQGLLVEPTHANGAMLHIVCSG